MIKELFNRIFKNRNISLWEKGYNYVMSSIDKGVTVSELEAEIGGVGLHTFSDFDEGMLAAIKLIEKYPHCFKLKLIEKYPHCFK